MENDNLKTESNNANVLLGISKKPLPIALIGAIYVAKGCDPDDVAEVTCNALKNGLNLADELYKAFYCDLRFAYKSRFFNGFYTLLCFRFAWGGINN